MDRGQFIDIGDFDVDAVDLDSAPQSAEHYLQQVKRGLFFLTPLR
ncbi:unnamed protein product [Nippostrongylus brasiliensis]|uniref:Oxidoreductase n=1 Tax=Nippostrongylus brasiliensis TaxID=27835 RepID=A0A0N4XJB7_NIPBR|nr:unnamed protein product [Nippostrongylus brasiliensis]